MGNWEPLNAVCCPGTTEESEDRSKVMRFGLWQEVTTYKMDGGGQLPQARWSGSLQRLCHPWPGLALQGRVSRTAEI